MRSRQAGGGREEVDAKLTHTLLLLRTPSSTTSIYLAMHSLQGRVKANDPANSLENLCRKSLSLGGAKEPQDGSHEFMSIFSYPTRSRRRTTVHLHPDVVEFLQCGWSAGGGNANVHIAWRKGNGVPGAIHTIKLSEIKVPGRLKCPIETPVGQGMAIGVNLGNLDVEDGEETEGGMMERIHGQGREWWEEGCTSAKVYELG